MIKESWKAMRDENTSCSTSEGWHVKWGFDPGDCFTVFPLLPQLPGESGEDRWTRSFCPLKAKGEMLCIESNVVEALLRRMLEVYFDADLDINSRKVTPWRLQGFDWYYDNAYTVSECGVIRDKLRVLSSMLEGIPADRRIYVSGDGRIVAAGAESDEAWGSLPAGEAARDCTLISSLLEKVLISAEAQQAVVTFSGP